MNTHEQQEKTIDELQNELDNLQIWYSRMFLAVSMKGVLHDLFVRIQEVKDELKRKTKS